MTTKKYSAQFKIDKVEQYKQEKEKQPEMTMAEFARKNNLAVTTFYGWLLKQQKEEVGFYNITNKLKQLEQSKVTDEVLSSTDKIKMTYNGVIIELDSSHLERTLNILKSW